MQDAERMRQETWQNINNGTRNAMDDIRRRTVEEPWYGRTLDAPYERPTTGFYGSVTPERGADPGTANQGTIHQSPLDQDKGQGDIGGGAYNTPPDKGPGGNSIDAFYGRTKEGQGTIHQAPGAPDKGQTTIHGNPTDQGKTGQDAPSNDTMARFYGPAREQGQASEQGRGPGQGMEP